MKKLFAILLLLTMCIGVFAACNGSQPGITDTTPDTTVDETTGGDEAATLEDAVAYLTSTYKSDEGKATPADYKLIAQIPIGEVSFEVTWTVDLDTIKITLADGLYTVDVPAKNDEEKAYTLTATIKDAAGNSETKTFTRTLPVYDNSAAVDADDIKENTPYKLYLVQVGVGKTLFATTEVQGDNKYIKTDVDPKKGADFFAEKVEGGYKFYTEIGGVKNYVHAQGIASDDGKVSKYIGYATESDCVYYFKADCNAWFVKIDNIEYVVGTYGDYETICISEGTYMTPTTTGVTQFPVLLMDKEKAEALDPTVPEIPKDEEKTIVEFNEIASAQPDKGAATLGKYIVTGKITEIKDTQYGNMYIADEAGNQLYIYGLYDNTGDKRFDAMNPQPKVGDTVVVLGVACNYKGPQMKNAWVIKLNGEDYVGSGSTETPDNPDLPTSDPVIPEAGKAYNFYFIQKNKNNTVYYLTGVLDGFYAATTENAAEAVAFTLETVDGGFHLTCTVGGAKKFVNVIEAEGTDGKTHINIKFDDAASSVWTIDETLKTVVTTLGETKYIIGTRSDKSYTTLGPMKIDSGCMYAQFILPGNTPSVPSTPDTPDTPVVPAGDKTITEFNEIASAQPDKGDATADKYTVTGKITEIKHETYGNMYIEDDNGNKLYIYGVYSADGKVRFDAMNPQPKVGDTIVITGVACNYNGPQMKNGWILKLNGNDYVTSEPEPDPAPEIPSGAAASIAFNNVANRTEMSEAKQVWTSNGLTMTNERGESTQPVKDYTDPVRVYAKTNLTIAYTGMKKIVVECNTAAYAEVLAANVPSAGSISAEGSVVTITFSDAVNSVSFTTLTAQVRINSISVYTA